jgi:hypothetical protein
MLPVTVISNARAKFPPACLVKMAPALTCNVRLFLGKRTDEKWCAFPPGWISFFPLVCRGYIWYTQQVELCKERWGRSSHRAWHAEKYGLRTDIPTRCQTDLFVKMFFVSGKVIADMHVLDGGLCFGRKCRVIEGKKSFGDVRFGWTQYQADLELGRLDGRKLHQSRTHSTGNEKHGHHAQRKGPGSAIVVSHMSTL